MIAIDTEAFFTLLGEHLGTTADELYLSNLVNEKNRTDFPQFVLQAFAHFSVSMKERAIAIEEDPETFGDVLQILNLVALHRRLEPEEWERLQELWAKGARGEHRTRDCWEMANLEDSHPRYYSCKHGRLYMRECSKCPEEEAVEREEAAWRKGADWMKQQAIQETYSVEQRKGPQSPVWIRRMIGEVRVFKFNPFSK